MAHRNISRGQKDFLRLQEAVEQIIGNDDTDAEYDILVVGIQQSNLLWVNR